MHSPGTRMRRDRLDRLLDSLSDRRLVAVLADAGSGKTEALRTWTAGAPGVTCWLTLGDGHTDPARLLADLVALTAPHCTGLADRLDPELSAHTTAGQPADAETLAAALAEALAAAWGDTLDDLPNGTLRIVLDDLHVLDGSPGQDFVTGLVRLYPRGVQLVLASRTVPAFGVERLRGAGEYGELGQRALLFDAAETAALFAAFGVPLDDDDAAAVTAACAGWATAVRLAVESALTTGTRRLREQVASPAAAAERLTAAVLTPLAPGVRRVLRALAVLGTVPRVVVDDRQGEVHDLDVLAGRGLLVHAVDDAYELTELAAYAVDLADPVDDEQRVAILRNAVDAATKAGLAEPALRWSLELTDPGLVADAVARFGTELLDARVVAPLLAAGDLLADPVGEPRIDALFAQLFAQRGEVHRALAHLARLGPDTPLPPAVAWRVAGALWMQGESAHAAAVLDRTAAEGNTADLSLVAAARATLAWGRGDGAAGHRYADDALALARRAGDDAALASAWVAQALVAVLDGDLDRNRQAYANGLRHAHAAGDVLTEVRIRCNVGSQLFETGRYHEALAGLDEAVRLGEATGQTALVALSRCNQADARLGLGQLEQALQAYDDALSSWAAIDSPMAVHAHNGRGNTLARRGDAARAAAAYRQAIAIGERYDDAQALVPALAGLARVTAGEDPATAAALVRRGLAEPAAVGSLPVYLAAGWVALGGGDHAAAARRARETATEAARRHAPAELAEALLLGVLADAAADPSAAFAGDARLAEAREIWRELDNPLGEGEVELVTARLAGDAEATRSARVRLRGLGVRDSATRVAGPLAVLDARPAPDATTPPQRVAAAPAVALRTLGTFLVLRDGTPVPNSAWQSRKARDLVKILAARRGRSIGRESLAGLLWPDSDATGNRLSVALSTARAVLDPDKAFPADRYIGADRGAVRLVLDTVALDTEDFVARADAALTAAEQADGDDADAIVALEAAVAAYPGDFCAEDPYESWAEQTRNELRARHQQVLRTLAELLAASPRPDTAVPWLITLLGADPFDEPTHLRLVRALVRSGRHGEARRAYRTYTERMAEIDVEPAAFPQTRARRAP